MPRFYHISDALTGCPSGTVGIVPPLADDDSLTLRPLNPLGFAPIAPGNHGTFTISLSLEGW